MLPLVPISLSLTILMGATLFIVSPDSERKAAAALADDMLRYHQAVLMNVNQTAAIVDPNLDDIEIAIDLGPFNILTAWDSAIAVEVQLDSLGMEVEVAKWLLTWPRYFNDSEIVKKTDLVSIPFKLKTSGFKNSNFGSWSPGSQIGEGTLPNMGRLRLPSSVVPISDSAPVLANRVDL